jgi:hypothetical protein
MPKYHRIKDKDGERNLYQKARSPLSHSQFPQNFAALHETGVMRYKHGMGLWSSSDC